MTIIFLYSTENFYILHGGHMIKGVNKRIIEINNPESIYFEKAIFYLKPNVRELPSVVSQNEINRYISRLGLDDYGKLKKHRFWKKLILSACILAAAAIVIAFIL